MNNVIITFLFVCGLGGGFFLGVAGLLLLPVTFLYFGFLLIKNRTVFLPESRIITNLDNLNGYDLKEPKGINYQFDSSVTMIVDEEREKQDSLNGTQVFGLKI